MAQTTATVVDDEPYSDAEIEAVLDGTVPDAPGTPESAPPAAPKRGRGRPPGSRNKPKSPGIGAPPPPPRARPRSTGRRGAAKGPTTEQRILAAWGIPVALAGVGGQILDSDALRADAVTLDHYGAGVAKVVAPLADQSPTFMALLDRLSGDAAPWVAAAMLGISMSAQLAVNHGLVQPRTVASFGAVPREVLLGTPAEAEQTRRHQEAAANPETMAAAQKLADTWTADQPGDPWAAGSVPPDWQ